MHIKRDPSFIENITVNCQLNILEYLNLRFSGYYAAYDRLKVSLDEEKSRFWLNWGKVCAHHCVHGWYCVLYILLWYSKYLILMQVFHCMLLRQNVYTKFCHDCLTIRVDTLQKTLPPQTNSVMWGTTSGSRLRKY